MNIAIIGGGPVGSLLSIFLAKQGHSITVFEKRPDMRKEKISAGRSINMAVSDRGWKALNKVGLEIEIKKMAIPMRGRMIHDINGNTNLQPYGKEGQAIYSISRQGLNQELLTHAESYNNVNLQFNARCADITMKNNRITILNETTGKTDFFDFDIIFGADGGGSIVRKVLQEVNGKEYEEKFLEHGYKELSILPNSNGTHQLEKNALHIWPRKQFMLIALPNMDGSFTLTLFFPMKGILSFESLNTPDKIEGFFQNYFPDISTRMSNMIEDFKTNPASILGYVKCSPWFYKDKIALIGDAAHAIVPFYGQGMVCGFEDCSVLDDIMDSNTNWTNIFESYHKSRKPNGDAILELALNNFIEMRDLVADPDFVERKKIEKLLNEKYPDKWVPLYSMVAFSHMPYKKALETGKKQEKIIREILTIKNLKESWESDIVQSQVLKVMDKLLTQ